MDPLPIAMEYFTFMTQHWETMLEDNQTRIRHFYIRSTTHGCKNDVFKLSQHYGDEIHHALLSWIRKEHETQQLFQPKNWTAQRDTNLHHLYEIYVRDFQYKNFIFQLTLDMVEEFATEEPYVHFLLSYSGKKDETYPPENGLILLPYAIMEDRIKHRVHWLLEHCINWKKPTWEEMTEYQKQSWEEHLKYLKHYELYFDYMSENVETMVTRPFLDIFFTINESTKYKNDIINEFIRWIQNEKTKTLCKNEYWKPVKETLRYRKLFQYKDVYYQVALDKSHCDNFFDCTECEINQYHVHFILISYGLYHETSKIIQDNNYLVLLPDNHLPDFWWENHDML